MASTSLTEYPKAISTNEKVSALSLHDEHKKEIDDLENEIDGIQFADYVDEMQLADLMGLVKDLSEPYSIFTYRYFLHQWPELCIMAMSNGLPIGCVICKIDEEEVMPDQVAVVATAAGSENIEEDNKKSQPLSNNNQPNVKTKKSGYIAMLAVDKKQRKGGIGTELVCRALERMRKAGCVSVVLETEVSNEAAMRLYERLGFVREELLVKYYLNWGDAYRLRLWFD